MQQIGNWYEKELATDEHGQNFYGLLSYRHIKYFI